MKKIVNGKVVDIPNIELFELAAEGVAIENFTASKVNNRVASNSNEINSFIQVYEMLLKSIPYPLYAIDIELKYIVIGKIIHDVIKNKADNKLWVDKGLWVELRNCNKALKFVNSTWSIETISDEKIESIQEVSTIDLDDYKGTLGYKEFMWLEKSIKNRLKKSFYETFMEEFVEACNNDSQLIKWEIMNILKFHNIPEKEELNKNEILDLERNRVLTLDIYLDGTRELGEKEHILSWYNGNCTYKGNNSKKINVYNYDLYEKHLDEKKNRRKKVDEKPDGTLALFQSLTSIKETKEAKNFDDYIGVVSDNFLIYIIDGRLFITKLFRYKEAIEIARGIEYISTVKGIVYFRKKTRVHKGIDKVMTYYYSIKRDEIKLCSIQFEEA